MLYTQTVEPGTLSVLKKLMALSPLEDFSLVGGTALALRYGHRVSVDIDLFSEKDFEKEKVLEALKTAFGKDLVYEGGTEKFGIFCFIHEVKTDIIHFPHALINTVDFQEDIRLYSDPDIAAMKLNAVLGRGKKKDFWDIFELLQHYSLDQLIHWHRQKYPDQMLLISVPQALTYFEDAEQSEEPVSLKGQSWNKVKEVIRQKVNDYLR